GLRSSLPFGSFVSSSCFRLVAAATANRFSGGDTRTSSNPIEGWSARTGDGTRIPTIARAAHCPASIGVGLPPTRGRGSAGVGRRGPRPGRLRGVLQPLLAIRLLTDGEAAWRRG